MSIISQFLKIKIRKKRESPVLQKACGLTGKQLCNQTDTNTHILYDIIIKIHNRNSPLYVFLFYTHIKKSVITQRSK